MRVRLGLRICVALTLGLAALACARENPAFDDPVETQADASGTSVADDTGAPTGAEAAELGEDCDVAGGQDMVIRVPQPCGETNDQLGVYEHWFMVDEADSLQSTWTVRFCQPGCMECEPLPGSLRIAPLPVAELAGPETCLLFTGRRLGTGDDCDYHAVTVKDMSAGGSVLVVAQRTELLEVPALDTASGLLGFKPGLDVDESCDCELAPSSCCGEQIRTRYAFKIGDQEFALSPDPEPVTINGRDFEFWPLNAYASGDCGAPIDIAWALSAI